MSWISSGNQEICLFGWILCNFFFFFNHKHSALLMVFHNFKTPLPWLPTMNNLAGSLGFVQGAIPSVLPLALSPVVGQSGKILCKSPPLGW